MPNIEDYIMQKREMYELETQLTNWQKKVDIMEMAARKAASTRKKRTGLTSRQASQV